MTDYQTMMRDAAGPTAGPLKEEVEKCEKALAEVKERIAATEKDIGRKQDALERHRASSTEKLASSTSAFQEWQGRLRRIERELASAKEALDLLRREVEPKARQDREAARKGLRGALVVACHKARAEAERLMGQAFADAVAEHDEFLAARADLFHEFDVSPERDDPPVIRSDRLGGHALHKKLTGPNWLTLTPPPKP